MQRVTKSMPFQKSHSKCSMPRSLSEYAIRRESLKVCHAQGLKSTETNLYCWTSAWKNLLAQSWSTHPDFFLLSVNSQRFTFSYGVRCLFADVRSCHWLFFHTFFVSNMLNDQIAVFPFVFQCRGLKYQRWEASTIRRVEPPVNVKGSMMFY